jgi:rare lipoprotein A
MFGFAGMQPGSAPAAVPTSMSAPLRALEAAPAAVEASYYGIGFEGRPTANGETFDPGQLTAAHRTLPFGTIVKVTDAVTGKSVDVRINDRGPFHGNREIDLSEAAARKIGMIGAGTAKVILETVRPG